MESQQPPSTPQEPSAGPNRRMRLVFVGVFVLALAGAVLWWMGFGSHAVQQAQYSRRTATFSGDSASLQQTVIVPTLDTPCPPGKNVIWCSSFQLAWNELRDSIIKAPLNVIGAEEIAARLNAAKQSVSDVDAKSVYARGGWVEKGIREQIRKDMAAKFPSHVLPDVNDHTEGILAYSYLTARVPFKHPFRQMDDGLVFTDCRGTQTRVAGFGLWRAYLRQYKNLREQVEVLYARLVEDQPSYEVAECAIDLCRHSKPYQVIIARVEPKGSLAETLDCVRRQIADSRKQLAYESDSQFGVNDRLKVPDMFWRIDHRFKELISKVVTNSNPPMPIAEAIQTIEFRLDRCGAVLESESRLAILSGPRYFEFNRPFLICMQKRDAEQPFFVMWVDNAELLAPK